jgi:hypothetical protein
MKYNQNLPVDESNRPLLSIHKSCGNLIYSLLNWGHQGKRDEPLKDFVDLLRYLRMANAGMGPDYFSTNNMETTTRGKGGY